MTTREQIIAAAKEAGFKIFSNSIVAAENGSSGLATTLCDRLYAIAFEAGRVAEREECAKVCEKNLHSWDGTSDRNDDYRSAHIRDIVDIRVRSTK